jgi:hypothetical protein
VATSYSVNVGLGISAIGDRGWGDVVIANWQLLDSLAAIGGLGVQPTEQPSTSLNIKVGAGSYVNQVGVISSFAGSISFVLTATSTNYLYLDLTASGALTNSTSGWPATAHVRLATVTTGSGSVGTILDARTQVTAVGPWADGANIAVGTSTGTQIGTSASQKLALWGKTPVVQQTGGSATAGSTWTSTEMGMLNTLYQMARTIGLLS